MENKVTEFLENLRYDLIKKNPDNEYYEFKREELREKIKEFIMDYSWKRE